MYVPGGWELGKCPTELPPDHLIEVMLKNGNTFLLPYEDINASSWVQENHPRDIVRYRFVSTNVIV